MEKHDMNSDRMFNFNITPVFILDCVDTLVMLDLRIDRALSCRRVEFEKILIASRVLRAVNIVEFLNELRYQQLVYELDLNILIEDELGPLEQRLLLLAEFGVIERDVSAFIRRCSHGSVGREE
jgi:hypothetical protein